jgi:uncharacterized protein YqgC (DUF456 family)
MSALAVAALCLMLLGLAGIVIPGIPAVLLVFGAAAIYALVSGFDEFGIGWLALMGVIAAAATAFDIIAAPAVARRFGASKWGVIGAIVGLIAGFLVGGPFGAILGPLVGAVAFEAIFGQSIRQAFRSGLGTAVGYVASLAVDATACLAIIALFVVLVVT